MLSADRGRTVAIEPGLRPSEDGRAVARPLALPALAAALHVASSAAKAARAKLDAARKVRPFVHEDQPAD